MNNAFISKNGLQDDKIVKALRKAANDYENGELSEVQDTLNEIAWAIQEFNNRCEKAGECV